jgi:transposase-like protein
MSTKPDCPQCSSHDIRRLKTAVIGISGFRCHECAKLFYVASVDVANRIRDAQRENRDEPVHHGAETARHT